MRPREQATRSEQAARGAAAPPWWRKLRDQAEAAGRRAWWLGLRGMVCVFLVSELAFYYADTAADSGRILPGLLHPTGHMVELSHGQTHYTLRVPPPVARRAGAAPEPNGTGLQLRSNTNATQGGHAPPTSRWEATAPAPRQSTSARRRSGTTPRLGADMQVAAGLVGNAH